MACKYCKPNVNMYLLYTESFLFFYFFETWLDCAVLLVWGVLGRGWACHLLSTIFLQNRWKVFLMNTVKTIVPIMETYCIWAGFFGGHFTLKRCTRFLIRRRGLRKCIRDLQVANFPLGFLALKKYKSNAGTGKWDPWANLKQFQTFEICFK